MTTQAVKATVGSGSFSKIFTLTATDDQWDGNSLTGIQFRANHLVF